MKSIQQNGILLGCTQILGFGFVSYYGPRLKRVNSTVMCLALELVGGLMLFLLSRMQDSKLNRISQSVVSTFWMTSVVSAHMSLLYFQNAESFPTAIKGKAVACILLFGKLSGACAPIIEEYMK